MDRNSAGGDTFPSDRRSAVLKTVNFAAAAFIAICSSACAQTAAERGRYLAVLGDCEGCHASPGGKSLAGGQPLISPFGKLYSSNITPDRTTGIGNWSAEDFYRAMHSGIRPDGAHLYPAFPFAYFTHLGHADTDALYAYLRGQPPVRQAQPPDALAFPFNIRSLMTFWDALFLDTSPIRPDAKQSAAWNRGRFIVEGPGHCAECHTPKNALFGDKTGEALRGESVDHWFAADLTGTQRGGLGLWTAQDIAAFLKTGVTGRATAIGPMQDVVAKSTSRMSDVDRSAIAAYLKSLPPHNMAIPAAPAAAEMQAGHDIFVEHCSVCHQGSARLDIGGFPLLPNNTLVQGRNPVTVLRLILGGSQSVALAGTKTSYSMPSFAALSDGEIASVATFIRNAWGNRASPVKPQDVSTLRAAIAASP